MGRKRSGPEGRAVGVNRIMLLVAVVLGVLAMLLAFIYLSTAGASGSAQQADPTVNERTVEILQVVGDHPAGHKINAETDLRTIEVPRDTFEALVQSSVRASEKAAIDGRALGMPASAGQPLTYAHFALAKDIELAPDRRAYAVEVGGAAALQGLLMPGDKIDLVVLLPRQADQTTQRPDIDPSQMTSEQQDQLVRQMTGAFFNQVIEGAMGANGFEPKVLLEDVRVIAVGNQLVGSRLTALTGAGRGRGSNSDMITLDVSVQEALTIAEHAMHQFQIMLRPSERPTTSDNAPVQRGGLGAPSGG